MPWHRIPGRVGEPPAAPPFPHHDAHPGGSSGGRTLTHTQTPSWHCSSPWVRGFPARSKPCQEDLCPRRLRRAKCVRSAAAGAPGSGAPECELRGETRGAGAGSPARRMGEAQGTMGVCGGVLGPLGGLTWSCWLRTAAATASRFASSTLLQRLRAPPRPPPPSGAGSAPRSPPPRRRRPAPARPAQSGAGKCRRVRE